MGQTGLKQWLTSALVIIVLMWTASAEAQPSKLVSLIQLIANPETFHLQRVILYGYVMLEFEHKAVYLSEGDAKRGTAPNGLWLDVPMGGAIYENRNTAHGRYVLVEGTFNARRRGHGGLFSGAIEHVTRFEIQRN